MTNTNKAAADHYAAMLAEAQRHAEPDGIRTDDRLQAAISRCIDNAFSDWPLPGNSDERARGFVARLSGSLEFLGETALAEKVFSLLRSQA